MTNAADKPEEKVPEKSPESTLERIQLWANLAEGVKSKEIKAAMMALESGQKLYDIFVEAVSKEIEHMINPSAETPKEIVNALAAAQNLHTQVAYIYSAIAELNNMKLLGVLNMLNTSLGGNTFSAPPHSQNQMPQQIQQQPVEQGPVEQGPAPQRPAQSAVPSRSRNSGTGVNW